jgi:hypothetical protein
MQKQLESSCRDHLLRGLLIIASLEEDGKRRRGKKQEEEEEEGNQNRGFMVLWMSIIENLLLTFAKTREQLDSVLPY